MCLWDGICIIKYCFRLSSRSFIVFILHLTEIWLYLYVRWGFPGGLVVKNLLAKAGGTRDVVSIPGSGRSPGVGKGNSPQYFCLENSNLAGYHPWSHKESDMTEWLSTSMQVSEDIYFFLYRYPIYWISQFLEKLILFSLYSVSPLHKINDCMYVALCL